MTDSGPALESHRSKRAGLPNNGCLQERGITGDSLPSTTSQENGLVASCYSLILLHSSPGLSKKSTLGPARSLPQGREGREDEAARNLDKELPGMGTSHSLTAPTSLKKTSRRTRGHDKRFGGNLCLPSSNSFLSCEPLWAQLKGQTRGRATAQLPCCAAFSPVTLNWRRFCSPRRQAISGVIFGCRNWGRRV